MVNRFGSVRQVGMTVALLLVAMLIVIPLFLILLSSVYENSSWNFFKPFEVMQSGGLAGIFLNSMLLGVLVVIGATIFAFPLAFIMSKTDVGKHSKLDIVFYDSIYDSAVYWIDGLDFVHATERLFRTVFSDAKDDFIFVF